MKLQKKIAMLLGASVLAVTTSSVLAHTQYLLPSTFGLTKNAVTLLAALTEDDILAPEMPIKEGEYYKVSPSGERVKLDKVVSLKNFAAIDIELPENGTYKITTGEKAGRITKMAKIDGRWLMIRTPRPDAEKEGNTKPRAEAPAVKNAAPEAAPRFIEEAKVPKDAEVITTETINKLETYLTKGAPSNGALKITGQGFEVKPLINPNEIFLDQGASFEVLSDGKPVKDLLFTLYRGGNSYEDKKISSEVKTDAAGHLTLKFDRPGVYMMKARYPSVGKGPITEKPAARSYSYTLTFEVAR
ncbi:MAG: DUF4198 domain-containing protein [Pseudomonadota bacterium]